MRWGTTVKHWSVTNLPSDNLLRADFCLGELDTCFTCNSHVVNSINREGLPLQQEKIFRHVQDKELHPCLIQVFQGCLFYLEREANKNVVMWRWWCKYVCLYLVSLTSDGVWVKKLRFQTSLMPILNEEWIRKNVYLKLVLKNGL